MTTPVQDTILLVDDTPYNLSALLNLLSRSGFRILVASEGKQALESMQHVRPDLILLDIMMPDMDGFEVCKYLKSQEDTKDIPIIFITALADTVSKVEGFNLGAADYITKPFRQEEVLARVNAHLTIVKQKRQLREHALELEKRNLELDAFAHTVAHDLKNPLSTLTAIVRLFLETVKEGNCLEAEWIKRLQFVEKSGRHTINIINALLILAGVSRQPKVEMERLDMAAIIDQVIYQRLNLSEEDLTRISLPSQWPAVVGYSPWIEEIWFNYLSNGLKYGGKPPYLTLGADLRDDDQVRFWVYDNGVGLTAEQQSKLFTPFTRLHRNQAEGHGLGLSIVQQIAEKLGGTVGVESVEGNGSLFYFTLPRYLKT